jgi:hypothetical protein
MTSTQVEKVPVHEAMQRARGFFKEHAASQKTEQARALYEHLHQVVASLEETASLVAHLQVQLDEVRHGMGLHLESAGPVPHTRRTRR